jgi:hypothetical protein
MAMRSLNALLALLPLLRGRSNGSSFPAIGTQRQLHHLFEPRLPRGRFLVNVEEAQLPPLHIVDRAYVTFTTNTPYVPGVEALWQSLAETHTEVWGLCSSGPRVTRFDVPRRYIMACDLPVSRSDI